MIRRFLNRVRAKAAQEAIDKMTELRLMSCEGRDGTFNAMMTTAFIPILSQMLMDTLLNNGAKNYVEWMVTHPKHGGFILGIQRAAGKRPSEVANSALKLLQKILENPSQQFTDEIRKLLQESGRLPDDQPPTT